MQKMAILNSQISPLLHLWINKSEFHLLAKLAALLEISEQGYKQVINTEK